MKKEVVGLVAKDLSPFEIALKKAIVDKIREEKRDGTMSMGLENLMQVVRSPSTSLEGAPIGGNARYYYKEMFRDLCKGERFVMASDLREERIVCSILAKYPDSSPTEQDRKEWREQGEKRRKEDGIRPRKAGSAMFLIRGLEQALRAIHHARFDMATSMMSVDDVKEMEVIAEKIEVESEKLLGLCQQEMSYVA